MSRRSSIIPEIKECFPSDFASGFFFAQVTFSQWAWRVFSVFAATTTAAPAFRLGGWRGSLCWRHLHRRSPPLEKTSHKNKQDTSLRCPFKSLQSENVTSKATSPTGQGLLVLHCYQESYRKARFMFLSSSIKVQLPGILKCGGCTDSSCLRNGAQLHECSTRPSGGKYQK